MQKLFSRFADELKILFDVALCQHEYNETCTCPPQLKIPTLWKEFISDQRGPRLLKGVLSSRNMSLRTATDKTRQAQEYKDRIRFKLEESYRDQQIEKLKEATNKEKMTKSYLKV